MEGIIKSLQLLLRNFHNLSIRWIWGFIKVLFFIPPFLRYYFSSMIIVLHGIWCCISFFLFTPSGELIFPIIAIRYNNLLTFDFLHLRTPSLMPCSFYILRLKSIFINIRLTKIQSWYSLIWLLGFPSRQRLIDRWSLRWRVVFASVLLVLL